MADSPLETLKNARSITELPLVRQFALIAAVAMAIAGGLYLFTWSQQPAYVSLYPGLNEKDSADLADVLRQSAIPYRLDPVSGAVTVPGDKVNEARIRAASAGLPKSAAMGFEMIQQNESFGTSQFMENARYQLALETELARTISSLQPVKSARVHLALPRPSPFTQGNGNTSASVLVELQPGRELEANQVDSIRHMVASSVPNLTASNVTVIDQFGRLLSGQDSNSPIAQSTQQYQYARHVEADYVRRIEQLLAPMLGIDHVSAQVAADFDFSETEEAKESYDPKSQAVRSEQTTEDMTRGANGGPAGIPGATSNQPPVSGTSAATGQSAANAPPAPNAATPANASNPNQPTGALPAAGSTTASTATDNVTTQSKSETRNYEIDRTLSHTRQPVGRLRRLSVAVLVDNMTKPDDKGKSTTVPLTAEELAKVDALVKQAIGFDSTRGDTVTVQNAPFRADIPAPVAPEAIWKRAEIRDYVRQALGAIVVLILIFAVLRPLLRSLMTPRKFVADSGDGEVDVQRAALAHQAGQLALASNGAEAAAGAIPLAPPAYEQRLTAARGVVTQDPKRVAQVVKTWVNEDAG